MKRFERSALREVATLAWPIAIAMLGETAMSLVDTSLVARLGAAALGGVGVAVTLMFLSYSIVFGMMRGVKVRVAHAVGEGRTEDAAAYARAGVVIGGLAGLVVWALARDVRPVLALLGIEGELVPYACEFLAARTYGAPFICIICALVQHRQATGDSRTPMITGLAANLLNAGLAYSLIYGRFGLPALGVRGAGYGTAIAEAAQAVVLLLLFARAQPRAGVRSALTMRRAAREVATLGVPTGLQFGAEMLAFTTFTAILGAMPAYQIAAHQVAISIIRTSFLPGIAVAEAASVLVGRALGQRRLDVADRVTVAAIGLAVGFMTLCGLCFAVFGEALARAFTPDAKVVEVARQLLLVAAVFQTLDAVQIVLRGSLRAAKDVRVVALIGIGIIWCCVPSAAFVLGRELGWGAVGGWCGFIAETTLSSGLFWWRWRRGAWRNDYAPTPLDAKVGPAAGWIPDGQVAG